jgi:hypothetical protein
VNVIPIPFVNNSVSRRGPLKLNVNVRLGDADGPLELERPGYHPTPRYPPMDDIRMNVDGHLYITIYAQNGPTTF